MDGTENLAETFLEMHHLMHEYHMAWYLKNFGGIDPKHGQGRILKALSHLDAVTQKELGFIMEMRPQSLGELLQKLEAHGYISRRRSPRDKRSLIVELTEKGEQFLHSRPVYESLFDDMSEDERENLRCSFQKIGDKLKELTIALENEGKEDENNAVNENNEVDENDAVDNNAAVDNNVAVDNNDAVDENDAVVENDEKIIH